MNIFDDGATEILAKALEIIRETELLMVVDNPQGGPAMTKEAVRMYAFALCGEVHELADTLGWKAWKQPQAVNRTRTEDEFADVLAFLGTLAQLAVGLAHTSDQRLANQFRAKSQRNVQRINHGAELGYGGPLAGSVLVKAEMVPGNYYEVERLGKRFVAHLEGYSENSQIFVFKLQRADEQGLQTWYLSAHDDTWVGRPVVGVANG